MKNATGNMKSILFLHPNFPGQFRHLVKTLGQDQNYQVVFATNNQQGNIPGVKKVIYQPSRTVASQTHYYIRNLENAVLTGQAVYRMAQRLKNQGFIPDIIYGHSGWGLTLFIKEVFPQAELLCFFEWFYHSRGSDAGFDPCDPLSVDDICRIRVKNSPILLDLYHCDRGLSPTNWQRQQFPQEYHHKITVCHDGIDTNYFIPQPDTKLFLPSINLDLSHVTELVTYSARGFEPYRGFPQFMEAVALIQQQRPNCHIVVDGEDKVFYSKHLADGKTYKQLMLESLDLDLSRLHFTGRLPTHEYLQLLQASSAHIYLTRPFVLSWSMLEAMSVGCLLIASNTPPVVEIIEDGKNGLLADFFSPVQIAEKVNLALDNAEDMKVIRAAARKTIVNNYNLAALLPKQLDWIFGKKTSLNSYGLRI
jgi:glycosyltransferase involved in cell wall biosynthesis